MRSQIYYSRRNMRKLRHIILVACLMHQSETSSDAIRKFFYKKFSFHNYLEIFKIRIIEFNRLNIMYILHRNCIQYSTLGNKMS